MGDAPFDPTILLWNLGCYAFSAVTANTWSFDGTGPYVSPIESYIDGNGSSLIHFSCHFHDFSSRCHESYRRNPIVASLLVL